MDSELNKMNFKRLYEDIFNQGHLDAADELIALDIIEHQAQPGVDPAAQGRELVKQIARFYHAAFPDLNISIENMIADGDRVAGRVTITGTHRGELMGIPPTGKHVQFGSIDIIRYENGLAVEHWGETDGMGLMQQLGAVPSA